MRKLWSSAMVVAVATITIVGCGEAEARMCRQSGEAEFCLVEDGQAFQTTGHGFQPGSDVHIDVDDGAPRPVGAGPDELPVLRADQDGTFAGPDGVMGLLRGPDPQRVTVTGTDASGGEVRFDFTVPPAAG